MRWKTGRRSTNVEDRRGLRVTKGTMVGGGLGGIVVIVVALLLGVDPSMLANLGLGGSQTGTAQTEQQAVPAGQEEMVEFVSVVLADVEDTWHELFREVGRTYEEPKLVLFSGAVQSACGYASSATGPFYCPGDKMVYLDFSFFEDMKRKLNAEGDFAQAYVIAHEVGHHVQNLLGIMDQVRQIQSRSSKVESNRMTVRLELQADCFAGVWGYYANRSRLLEPGDLEEALNAANSIGDDRLQKQSQGYVVPDSFTHGTSAQRMRWFKRGFDSGDMGQCDTFNTDRL